MKLQDTKVVRTSLTVTQVARGAGVSRQRVDKLLRQGRIPAKLVKTKAGRTRRIYDTPKLREWMAASKGGRLLAIRPETPQGIELQRVARLKKSLDKANENAIQAIHRAGEICRDLREQLRALKDMHPRPVGLRKQLSDIGLNRDVRRRISSVPEYSEKLSRSSVADLLLATGAVFKKKKNGERIHEPLSLLDQFGEFCMGWNEFLENTAKVYPRGERTPDQKRKIALHLAPIAEFQRQMALEAESSQPSA